MNLWLNQLVMVEALNLSFDPKDSSSEQVEKAYFSSGLTIIVKQGKLS